MSDISHLFPQLASALENWDGRTEPTDGHDDPTHAGVTDDQIDDYLRSIGSLRAPLSPVVSGQSPPPTPEFRSGSGRTVPPGESYMEPPQVDIPTPSPEPDQPEPPAAPAADLPDLPDFYDIAGRRYDRKQAEAWAQFDQMVTSDPQLAQVIQQYLVNRSTLQTTPPLPSPTRPSEPPPPPVRPKYRPKA